MRYITLYNVKGCHRMNTDDLITVVSLANRLNVAKQTIFYHCNKLDIEATKIDNVSYLTHAEANSISERINKKNVSDKINKSVEHVHINTNEDVSTADPQVNLVDVLIEQLKVKDEQIKQLNNTLDEQQRLLHNQQSLQLQSSTTIKELELELKEVRLKLDESISDNKIVEDDSEKVITETVKVENKISAFWIAYTLLTSPFRKRR